jgi:hypothetical protein
MIEAIDVVSPELVTETSVDAACVEGRLVGSAEAANLDELTRYLEAIRRAAIAKKVSEVVLDIRSLEFMSAACLRSMLAWIGDGQRGSQCATRIVWDPLLPWQRRSLKSILSTRG